MKRDLSDPSHWVFNRLADEYQARPPYPDSLFDALCALLPGSSVADLGAGTGLLSRPLARRGFSVAAIEPSVAMRAALHGEANVNALHATAEQTTLPAQSVHAILAGEAAQWFALDQAVPEGRRILKRGGLVASIEWLTSKAPHQEKLQALLLRYNPKTRGRTNEPALRWVQQTCAKTPQQKSFASVIHWSLTRFVQATRSLSYIGPALGPERLARFEEELRSLLVEVYQGETFEEQREAALLWGFY
jgi:ubiquinone/menaquinone biosynthesis C-methylase UbiE